MIGVPIRRCAACRKPRRVAELLRFVVGPGGAVECDPLRQRGGRGTHTCAVRRCLLRAAQKGGFNRGFAGRLTKRVDGPALVDAVVEAITAELERLLARGIGDGRARWRPERPVNQVRREKLCSERVLLLDTAGATVYWRGEHVMLSDRRLRRSVLGLLGQLNELAPISPPDMAATVG